MTPEQFFEGRSTGFGVVRSFSGRVLRRFTLVMSGVWEEEHRALHLDETYSYVGGDTLQRSWAIHTDEQGHILGYDALQAARMRGRQRGKDFRVVFDRPRRPGGPLEPPQVVDFIEVTETQAIMTGHLTVAGFRLARLSAALRRES